MKKQRVLVIGLDGATWKVLLPLIKKGKVPFLSRLVKKSAYGTLKSIIPPLTPAAWASLATGTKPEKHHVFGFINYRQHPKPRFYNATDVAHETIWQHLGKKGLKSLIVNMPLTYPPLPMEGILVSSFFTPRGKGYTYPPKIQTRLDRMEYEIDIVNSGKYGGLPAGHLTNEQKKQISRRLIEISRKRAKAFKTLLKKEDFDFAFILFKGTDIAQHLFWQEKYLDDFYQQLDQIIENLVSEFNRLAGEKNLLIISDHGFHQTAKTQFAPFPWLIQEGYLDPQKDLHYFSQKLLSKARRRLSDVGLNIFGSEKFQAIDGLLVTMEGIYVLGPRKIKLTRLVQKLRDLRHENQKVFQKVILGKEGAPDVAWLPQEGFHINASIFAANIFEPHPSHIAGDHMADLDGIYLASGRQIKKVNGKVLEITDIFPLVCYLLGIGIPNDLDGCLPKEILKTVRKEIYEKDFIETQVDREIKELLSS